MSSTGTVTRPSCPPTSPLRPGTIPDSPGPSSSPPAGLHHDKAAEAGKYLPEKNKIKNNEKSVLLTMVGGLQQNSCLNANLCGNSSVKKQAGAKLGQSKICLNYKHIIIIIIRNI